jgi:BlaI family penicillinase repressor
MLREREWKLSTVRTFLARLEKKGVVEGRDAGGVKRYSPIFGREDCVRDASASFLDRVFEGAAGQLLMHFAKSKRLSARELDELEAILVQKRRGK